jgi:hypothetical protein
MQPSPAEVARTLATGRLLGTLRLAFRLESYRVRHATDCAGGVLLLSRAGGELATALAPADGADDIAAVLTVPDVPPVAGSPHLGQVSISGWAKVLTGVAAREAALEYAETNPTSDLLDVGRGFVLHRIEVAEVRLERSGSTVAGRGTRGCTIDIDPDEYVAAEPDPLHDDEHDLLVDLADHHATEVGSFVRRQVVAVGQEPGEEPPRVVRMDRYGFVAALGPASAERRVRLSFPRPVRDRPDLAQLLHPVLCPRCSC